MTAGWLLLGLVLIVPPALTFCGILVVAARMDRMHVELGQLSDLGVDWNYEVVD